jgi:hypothetical protein
VSSAVLADVAVGYVVAAIAAGPIGDRVGLARVIFFASFVYGGGLLAAGLPTHWHNYYFVFIFPVAVAAGMVMTLAWGLLFKLMPAQHRGAISGLATTTKGWGLLFDRPRLAVPEDHLRVSDPLASLRGSGARRDPARRLAPRGRGYGQAGAAARLSPKPHTCSSRT